MFLVGGFSPSEKYEFVSWADSSQCMEKIMFQTTNQCLMWLKPYKKKQWNWEFPHSVGTIEMGCLIIIRVMGLLFIGWDLRPTYQPFDQHGRGQRFLVTDAEDQRLALQDFWDFREVCGNVMKQQNPRISPLGILMYFIGISCLVKSCRWLNNVKSTLQSHFQAQSGHVDQDMGRKPCFSYPDPEVLKTFKRN